MLQLKQIQTSVTARDLSVVIPCFNEEAGIGAVLDDLEATFPDVEIIVVDDGSTDDSREIVLQHGRVRLLDHGRNRGYGASIRTGCAAATREYVVWYDADGQHRPEMIPALMQELGHSDCVIGARTERSHSSWLRKPGKCVLLWTARLLARHPIPDLNSGLRAFRTAVLRRYLHLLPNGFSASTTTTILMLERGYAVRWIPIATSARVGKSTVRQLRDGSRVIMLILHLVNMFSPLRFYMPVSVTLLGGGTLYGIARALISRHGFPTAGVVLIILGIQAFFFGLIADQISALRKERYEDLPADPGVSSGGSETTDEWRMSGRH